MTRLTASLFLATAAVAALAAASPATAQCVAGGTAEAPTITCGPATAPGTRVVSGADGLALTLEEGASLFSATQRAVQLFGTGQTVLNFGRIESGGENDGIRSTAGSGLTVDNAGEIVGTDRGIRLTGGGGLTLINREGGVISARRQAVRVDTEGAVIIPDTTVTNHGLIYSAEGRAIQARGQNTTVVNHGTLIGNEEVVEGRENFSLINHGLMAIEGLGWDPATRSWTDTGATIDEDGVQFSDGVVHNHGVILGTDDGIDIDEGHVHNHATGVIVSAGPDDLRSSAAVDVDPTYQFSDDRLPERPSGALTIVNEGYMEGPRAIVTDLGSEAPVTIVNSGTLVGRGGDAAVRIAVDLAPNQGETQIALFGASVVLGDILFGGAAQNTIFLGPFDDGARFEGVVRARDAEADAILVAAGLAEGATPFPALPGSGGFDVDLQALEIGHILGYLFRPEVFALELSAGSGSILFPFLKPNGFVFDGAYYDPGQFAALLSEQGVAPIPLPATLPLVLAGLGGLALLRRRRAA
jgi:hypothetical protein